MRRFSKVRGFSRGENRGVHEKRPSENERRFRSRSEKKKKTRKGRPFPRLPAAWKPPNSTGVLYDMLLQQLASRRGLERERGAPPAMPPPFREKKSVLIPQRSKSRPRPSLCRDAPSSNRPSLLCDGVDAIKAPCRCIGRAISQEIAGEGVASRPAFAIELL